MSDTDLSGAVIDGRYKVIEPIAEGAMGSVYRGERLKLGRAVAIKIMHQELPDELASRQRFEREAKLMALLEHPNCVSVIDFGVHEEKPFLVMDLVRGTSLLDLMEKSAQLDVANACDIIRQVLSGLAHAHELGIVHRDIKPANIMISEKAGLGQQVRILDFGLARLSEASKATKLTTGIVVGTPNYMAPEQCKGSDIDARTDLYACGVMLFEMLTGRKPFVADDPIQVVRKHLLEAPPTLAAALPRIDFGELEDVVKKALAKAPGDRFDSAVEMAKAIEVAATKLAKTSAAALYARAVPENPAAPAGGQLATMSGWNVPQAGNASASVLAEVSPSMMMEPGSTAMAPSTEPPTIRDVPSVADSGPVPAMSPAGVAPSAPVVVRAPDAPTIQNVPSVASPAESGPAWTGAPAAPVAASSAASGPAWTGAPASSTASGDPAFTSEAPSVTNGAPAAALQVPPTRPSTAAPAGAQATAPGAARPIPQLPLSKKHLLIGGGGVLVLIILVAVFAGGGGAKSGGKRSDKTATSTGGAAAAEPSGGDASAIVERANALIASEDYEAATSMLRKARKEHPQHAEIAFLAGKAFFGQLYWTDGIDSFRAAIELEPSYKENPELLKTVLKGFLTTPDVDDRIVDFMRHDIGLPLRSYLEETAEQHPKKHLRARARAELNAGR